MLSILIPPLSQVLPLQGTSELAKVKQSTLLRFTKNGDISDLRLRWECTMG